MSLIRWQKPEMNMLSPFRHLSNLREEIDRLFESPLNALTSSSQQFLSGWIPAIDLRENKDDMVLRAELPGMKREDIDVSLHGDMITLSGERKEEKDFKDSEVYRSERFLGKFQRSFTLPCAVDAGKVQADYKDGVLTVTLPKAEESRPKQIEVKVN
jgi:HSP20 family protein